MRRDDLIALDPTKLAALANIGLVKRATKDLAAGRGPTLKVLAEGTVVAVAGDVTTRLIPDTPLRDTPYLWRPQGLPAPGDGRARLPRETLGRCARR